MLGVKGKENEWWASQAWSGGTRGSGGRRGRAWSAGSGGNLVPFDLAFREGFHGVKMNSFDTETSSFQKRETITDTMGYI